MRRWWVFLLLLSLAGCDYATSPPPTLLPPVPPTATPSPVPPTATPTPTLTPTATPVPSPTPTATPIPPLEPTVELEPAQVYPGHTLVVRLYSALPVSATGVLEEAGLQLYPSEGGTVQVALLGISMWSAAGPQTLWLTATDSLGRRAVVSGTVEVLPVDYPVQSLEISPGRLSRLDPEVAEAEWERVQNILTTTTPERLWTGRFVRPAEGRISSPFGTLRSYNGAPPSSYHSGVDLANITGTVVVAPQWGRVALADQLVVRGGTVILDHGWGLHSCYFHLSAVLVEEGELVAPGQPIAEIGATGIYVTGAHLHWETRLGLIPVDPWDWVNRDWP